MLAYQCTSNTSRWLTQTSRQLLRSMVKPHLEADLTDAKSYMSREQVIAHSSTVRETRHRATELLQSLVLLRCKC